MDQIFRVFLYHLNFFIIEGKVNYWLIIICDKQRVLGFDEFIGIYYFSYDHGDLVNYRLVYKAQVLLIVS